MLTTATSSRSSSSAVRAAVPTGTVDLLTTTLPGGSSGRISSTTASTTDRSATPPTPIGVGTHRNTTSRPSTAAAAPTTNDSRPAAMPSDQLGQPGSRIPISPAQSRSTFAASTSAQTTRWPSEARQAPVVSPT